MSEFSQQLALQSWTLYGIGMVMISLRTFARWRRVQNLSQFAADDWLMVTAVPLFYTGLIVCLNTIATGGGSNLFPPEQYSTFTQEQIDNRIKGSKIVVVSEQCMLNVIWTLKACMLFMFARLMTGTAHLRWIKAVALWVVIGWFAVEIAFFTACRPFAGYWAVPPPNPQCTTLKHFAIVQAVFNISSDMLIIVLPIPMVMSLSLPPKQKIVLGLLIGMGTFVIVAAILTKVYNLSDVYDSAYMLWYTREASIAVYITNLPGIWPLLREHTCLLCEHTKLYITSHSKTPEDGYASQKNGKLSRNTRTRIFTDPVSDEIELEASDAKPIVHSIYTCERSGDNDPFVGSTTSRDSYVRALDVGAMRGWESWRVLGVQVDTRVEIQTDRWDGNDLEAGRSMVVRIEGPEMQAVTEEDDRR